MSLNLLHFLDHYILQLSFAIDPIPLYLPIVFTQLYFIETLVLIYGVLYLPGVHLLVHKVYNIFQ